MPPEHGHYHDDPPSWMLFLLVGIIFFGLGVAAAAYFLPIPHDPQDPPHAR